MAAVVSLTEEPPAATIDVADIKHWLRVDFDDDDAELAAIASGAWGRVEARIPNRYSPREAIAVVRADQDDDLFRFPLSPFTLSAAEYFDQSARSYAAEPLLSGPIADSLFLPRAGLWRLTGTAGPTPATAAPEAIELAVKRLVAFHYSCRGDCGEDGGLFITGAADLLRPYVRV